MKYCNQCKTTLEWQIPEGDNLHRHVCPNCKIIHYVNPKIIVGTLPIWEENKVLLCKRAIEPQKGLWTLPSGFMENKETTQEGALRETQEEANANVSIRYLHTLYSIPHISQVYLLFKADLLNVGFSPGVETLDVRIFPKSDIPWEEIAFLPVHYCLRIFTQEKLNEKNNKTHCGIFGEK